MTRQPFTLFFSDSEVAAVSSANGSIRILFSAAHVLRHSSNNSEKPIEGFARNVELILSGTKPDQTLNECIGRISSGRMFSENKWAPQATLPCIMPGPIKLELVFANQSHLEIEAIGLECRFGGKQNFFESMAC
jgi:hypothetical protein